jgi:hypothetical protein
MGCNATIVSQRFNPVNLSSRNSKLLAAIFGLSRMILWVVTVTHLLLLLLSGEVLEQDDKGMLLEAVREMIQNQYTVSLHLNSASVERLNFEETF